MNYFEEEDFVVRRRRRNEPDFWHRLNRVLTALVLVGVMFYPVWHKQQDMRSRIASLQKAQAEKTSRLRGLERERELLLNDPEYVETIARDRLNVMKPGETVFRIELPRTIGTSVQP